MKHKYFFKTFLLLIILSYTNNISAQLSIDAGATNYTIDFQTTLSGVNNGLYDGTGFVTTPSTGDLDTDAWKITGFSDGTKEFGIDQTGGDFARGQSNGGSASSGGIYAFEVEASNNALGFQGTGSDFTPGTIVLKISNNTGAPITSLDISYKIWVYNDQGRANSLNFSHSLDDSSYTNVDALDFTTTEAADISPAWVSTNKTTTINGLNLTAGAAFYIRWSSNDSSGSGSRDEIAIDDIVINATTGAATPTIGFNTSSSNVTETDSDLVTSGIPITLINHSADVTITPTINGSSTAEAGDYTIDLTPLIFNDSETNSIPLTIKDDADSDNETIIVDFTITSGSATLGTTQHTITITDDDLPNIIINEILADPTGIDANGDGSVSTTQDEFIELVNTDIVSYDLTGYTISDAGGVKHTFGAITIPAGGSVVVFGGGTPTGISGISDTASSGGLSLNNSGDSVILKNSGNATITTYTYGSEANNDQSIGRQPDLTGNFVQHLNISSNPINASPGKYNSSNLPFSTTTWKGSTNSDWTTSTNWSTGVAPGGSDNVLILKTTNQPTISSATTVNSITIESGASLVANAAVTGNVTYKRTLTNNWHLVSSPVNGETIQDLIANHTFAVQGGSNITMAPYNNDGTAWNYYTAASSGNLTSGSGLSAKLASAGDISFTGTLNTSNVTPAITQGAANNFNLVGNPFTSYITLGTFFSNNTGKFTEETIWMWNQATSSYDLKMSGTDDGFEIAPGQGFFVSANTDTTINFNANDQSHQTDTFQRSARTEINLTASENGKSKSTKIYFIEGTTKGFDNGYDGTAFSTSNKFALYSQLVSNNQGKNYAIQSLPIKEIDNIAIPIGLNALAGKEIKFSISSNNLPYNTKVYLEDRLNNELIDITDSAHTITLKNNINGIGQFYLRATSKKIDAPIATSIEEVSIYKSAPNTLSIIGLQTEKSSLKIYSLMGQKVADQNFDSNGFSTVTIPSLATGIYVIELSSELGKTSRKIILE